MKNSDLQAAINKIYDTEEKAMQNEEQIEAAIRFLQSMLFGGDYEEAIKIKGHISLAIEALQKELSEMEVSE